MLIPLKVYMVERLFAPLNEEENDGLAAYFLPYHISQSSEIYVLLCCIIGCCHDHHIKLANPINCHWVVVLL